MQWIWIFSESAHVYYTVFTITFQRVWFQLAIKKHDIFFFFGWKVTGLQVWSKCWLLVAASCCFETWHYVIHVCTWPWFQYANILFYFLDINYFHCIRIVELLKVSESATKNIFGGYSSKRMKVNCISLWMLLHWVLHGQKVVSQNVLCNTLSSNYGQMIP